MSDGNPISENTNPNQISGTGIESINEFNFPARFIAHDVTSVDTPQETEGQIKLSEVPKEIEQHNKTFWDFMDCVLTGKSQIHIKFLIPFIPFLGLFSLLFLIQQDNELGHLNEPIGYIYLALKVAILVICVLIAKKIIVNISKRQEMEKITKKK